MRLKKWGWKNVCSYGNSMQEVELSTNPELIVISGENGNGKTTIYNALMFALYGKNSKRRIKDLPNRINKNLHTFVEFDTKDDRRVDLHRGVQPNFFDLTIGDDKFNMADKVKLDNLVENQLINIPFDVATNTMMLSINEFKSFAKMKKDDKRKIINKIFPIEKIDKMHELLKDDVKAVKEEVGKIEYAITTHEGVLQSHKDELQKMTENAREADKTRIEQLVVEIGNLETRIELLTENRAELEEVKETLIRAAREYKNEVKGTHDELVASNDKKKEQMESEIEAAKQEVKDEFQDSFKKELADVNSEYQREVDAIKQRAEAAREKVRSNTDERRSASNAEFDAKLSANAKTFDGVLSGHREEMSGAESKIKERESKRDETTEVIAKAKADLAMAECNLEAHRNGVCENCGTNLEATSDHEAVMRKLEHDIKNYEGDIEQLEQMQTGHAHQIAELNKSRLLILDEIKKTSDNKGQIDREIEAERKAANDMIDEDERAKLKQIDALESEKVAAIDVDTRREFVRNKYANLIDERIRAKTCEIRENISKLDDENKKSTDKMLFEYERVDKENAVKTQAKDEEIAAKSEEITRLEINKGTLEKEKADLEAETSKKEAIDAKRKQINEGRLRLDDLALRKLEHEQELEKMERTRELFADDGLKRLVMNKFLPVFNSKINELIQELEYKFGFSFDNDFTPAVTHLGEEVSVESLSSGEEKMLDIIVILAMLELIKYRNPEMNIMFLDEIYNTLDPDNIRRVTRVLRKYADQYGITIFLISHTPVPMEYFDRHVLIKKDGLFSELEIK